MKPRNKEDVKPFDLDLAKAGHPVCQKNLDAAEIIGFGGFLNGMIGFVCYERYPAVWLSNGDCVSTDKALREETSLVLAPLGYCQDKPVFFGDVLVWEGGNITIDEKSLGHTFDDCTWPRKEPVMPKTSISRDQLAIWIDSFDAPGTRTGRITRMQDVGDKFVEHLLEMQLDEVIDYLVESGKVQRVQS